MRPFKSPLVGAAAHQYSIHRRQREAEADAGSDSQAENVAVVKAALPLLKAPTSTISPPRKPLLTLGQPIETKIEGHESGVRGRFAVLWRKPTNKKHKTWDDDAVLVISGGSARLQDDKGNVLGRSSWTKSELPEIDSEMSIGGKVILIESEIATSNSVAQSTPVRVPVTAPKLLTNRSLGHDSSENGIYSDSPLSRGAALGKRKRPLSKSDDSIGDEEEKPVRGLKARRRQEKLDAIQDKAALLLPRIITMRKIPHTKFKSPLLSNNVQARVDGPNEAPAPRHNPDAPGALVMKRPTKAPKGKRIVDVVVDPTLTENLREHQRAGVAFLYECVMGMRSYGGEGAILADEMGLGKTLQTIALLWTLLKQNPIYEDPPVVRKAVIVCPVSLTSNWRNEFWKWLGKERVSVFVANNERRTKITDFTMGRAYRVMIIGYDKLCQVQDELQKCDAIDLVIADEAHRLKSAQNQAAAAIKSLNTGRRIVLSGTPMQNNLSEYFALVDFVNPGLLGKYSAFKRKFEDAILAGQQIHPTSKHKKEAKERSKELAELTEQFILRRTADVISKFLPPKTEYVVFCNPEPAQANALRSAVSSRYIDACLENSQASLQLIHILKQICNCPSLVKPTASEPSEKLGNDARERVQDVLSSIDTSLPPLTNASTKMKVLETLLQRVRDLYPDEKVVIVSSYTSTLDLIQRHLQHGYLRLDGSTPAAKRGPLVEQFNKSPADKLFAFLLSAKAGGVGLNLVGANRLILFDTDWNPAVDLQAMSRIHRDGQKRQCYIYRLLVMGAMDEKIFQRQVSKRELADEIIDSKSNPACFSQDELRDLFTFDESGACKTHELLGCGCHGKGLHFDSEDLPDEDGVTELGVEGLLDSDEEVVETVPKRGSLVTVDKVDFEEEERRARDAVKGGKSKMKSLMQYRHINPLAFASLGSAEEADGDADGGTSTLTLEEAVDDAALVGCLNQSEGKSRIGYIFAKCTRA